MERLVAREGTEELWIFVWNGFELIGVRGRLPMIRNIGPSLREFLVMIDPHRRSRVAIRHDRLDRAFWLADAAVDAIALPYDKHALALVKAVHRADRYTIRIFAPYTAISHNKRHLDHFGMLIACERLRSNSAVRQGVPHQRGRQISYRDSFTSSLRLLIFAVGAESDPARTLQKVKQQIIQKANPSFLCWE